MESLLNGTVVPILTLAARWPQGFEVSMIVLLMGVSGSGKTTIGQLLAEEMGAVFADADDYHSPANKARMAAGIPLTDADRAPWLDILHGLLEGWHDSGTSGILACSALKAAYRVTLTRGLPDGAVRLVWLDASKQLLAGRLAHREHHYMNPALLDSQLATLEPPPDALHVINDRAPGVVVEGILEQLVAGT
jgi:gluconokinase